MKKIAFTSIICLLLFYALHAQETITVILDCTNHKLELKDKSKQPKNGCSLEFKAKEGTDCCKDMKINYEIGGGNSDPKQTIKLNEISEPIEGKTVTVSAVCGSGTPFPYGEIKFESTSSEKGIAILDFAPYNREKNIAYFHFDQNGDLVEPEAVNIDADDYLVIYMTIPTSMESQIKIKVEGEYKPSDLAIRPYERPANGEPSTSSNSADDPPMLITKTFGPFTSEKVVIKFYNNGKLMNYHNVRINKLYHVAIGASFVSTRLQKPKFDIFPLSGTQENTIDTINNGNRTLATFNVIFYWKSTVDWVTGKLNGNSNITRGRDILKEATFWERLNPTFGVSLDNAWRENFFAGGIFEFARGGSLTAGWHYGKVQELANKDFILGKTPFAGTKDDIKLSDRWKSNFFFGITLDTRIFNTIFNRK